jgi:Secreted and surface protein containing fasciclin-like repeats
LDSTLADETTTFTVFAPTDAAFAVLGDANIAALVGDTDALTEVLLQHVVSGAAIDSVTAYSANGTSVETASGAMIDVMIDGPSLTIGGATVTTADIYTTNGVIHVIDAVILGDVALP